MIENVTMVDNFRYVMNKLKIQL